VSNAKKYQIFAANCSGLAEGSNCQPDRTRFLRMEQSWLALAENEDWLAGLLPPSARRPNHGPAPLPVYSKDMHL
jgi:hypothetical protein